MENGNKKPQQTRNSKACADSSVRKSNELQVSKPWPRNSRREQPVTPRSEPRNSKQQQYITAKGKANVDKRPRIRNPAANNDPTCPTENFTSAGPRLANFEPTGSDQLDFELNSVYSPGSKKQNLNHLLNFHYASREPDHSVFGRGVRATNAGTQNRHLNGLGGGVVKKHKYNKEQFLQANFQFVIKSSAKPKLNESPDKLIDWSLIEQINIQTTEEPQCPICLYPPIAAKLTRCGHAFCWPCLLHYLALSDKSWRKCPICYEAIHTADLKSTAIIQQRQTNIGEQITFQLMRRKKNSMFIEKFTTYASPPKRYPSVSCSDEARLFSKVLIAKRSDIVNIIEREQRELLADEDVTCPEFVFVQQALDLLKERREKLGNFEVKEDEIDAKTAKKSSVEQFTDKENERNINELDNYEIPHTEEEQMAAEAASIVKTLEEGVLTETTEICFAANTMAPTTTTKFYYFYQSADGQNIYLHPLNVKMLQACYGSLDHAPLIINASILQMEQHSMDEEHRRKFTCLGHLPLTCQFSIYEVDLQPPDVTSEILNLFKSDLMLRSKGRQRRDRDERKREKQINEINDRQMGKLIASTVNLNLGSAAEFPTCGFEESLFGAVESDGSSTRMIPTPNRGVSYSAAAVVGKSRIAEHWHPLGSPPAAANHNRYKNLSTLGKVENERESINDAHHLCTNLSDVLAQAISQKQLNAAATPSGSKKLISSSSVGVGATKKHKKSKKMMPLFSTGINYKGN